jgi:hypothetical protein
MPLEIRELVIKVEITENRSSADGNDKLKYEQLKNELINECMKKMRSTIENLLER